MTSQGLARILAISALSAGFGAMSVSMADAGSRSKGGVRFAKGSSAKTSMREGRSALVSDGPGTGYGFHRLPAQFRVGAAIHRERQADALRAAVATDALTSGGFRSGRLGSDVAAHVPNSHYGVFSGADGYSSPFFAGYYGPGGGTDLGPLGTTYD